MIAVGTVIQMAAKAAVRQRFMARSMFRCWKLSQVRFCFNKAIAVGAK
jgi:hypothetical protein